MTPEQPSVQQGPMGAAASACRPFAWPVLAWFSLLFLLLFMPVLTGLVREWIHNEDMGHGFFVPLVAGWILYQKRGEILRTPVKPNYWGLFFVAWGGLQYLFGTLGVELFLQRTSFVIALAGAVLCLYGSAVFRVVFFPLFLLIFMIRIPAIIYNQITFPLQLFASRVAEFTLQLIGIPVLREGNVLELSMTKLSVVEACSGIRSLLSLSFLSLVYSYFFDKKVWMRYVLFLATIPIAILANAGRITFTGILAEYKPELAEGFFHMAEGWVVFMIALLLLIFVHTVINKVAAAYREAQTDHAGIS